MAYIEAAIETVPATSKWKQFYAGLAMKICKRLKYFSCDCRYLLLPLLDDNHDRLYKPKKPRSVYSSILYFHSMFFISCDPGISLEQLIRMQQEGNQSPDLPYHTLIPANEEVIKSMPVTILSHGRGPSALCSLHN